MKFKVYADYTLEDVPRSFYVGKGNDGRVRNIKRNKYHTAIALKYGIERRVLFETDSETDAFQKERELIQELKTYFFGGEGFWGANFTLGGEGVSGRVFSAEERRLISERIRGENHPMFERKHTEESKRQNSEANKFACSGEKNGMYGKRHSEETRRKIGAKSRGRITSEETKKRQSVANKGRSHTHSEETKRKLSEARKGRVPWNKGLKGAQIGHMKGKKHSEETRHKLSIARRNREKKHIPIRLDEVPTNEGT